MKFLNLLRETFSRSAQTQEPVYDDLTLEKILAMEDELLVSGLVDNVLRLQDEVLELRMAVNELSAMLGIEEPFPDPASDIAFTFEDYAAHKRYTHVLDRLVDW